MLNVDPNNVKMEIEGLWVAEKCISTNVLMSDRRIYIEPLYLYIIIKENKIAIVGYLQDPTKVTESQENLYILFASKM